MIKGKRPLYITLIIILICIVVSLTLVTANGVRVEIKKVDDIDVALTVGSTDLEVRYFEESLLNSLNEKGVDVNRVNVQAFESKTTSTETQDAAEIFADWESRNLLPSGSATDLRLGDTISGGWIAEGSRVIRDNTGSARPARAWINPVAPETDGATEISFTWGIDDTRYGSFEHGEAGLIFGIEDDRNFYAYIMDNHDLCGHIRFNGGEAIIKVVDGKITTLDSYNSFPRYTPGLKQDISILINNNVITVEREGVETLRAVDETKDVIEGKYGFYVWDQYGAYFDKISFTNEFKRGFNEVIRQPEWRDGSKRFVVNMEDEEQPEFDDEHALGEILTRLTNERIHYVGVGSENNKAQGNRLINRNSGNGTFIDSSKEYNEIINDIADYIVNNLDTGESEEYVLIDQKTEIIVSPPEIMRDTKTPEYPDGRWRIEHEYDFYENGSGLHELSGKYFSDFDVNFDRPGRYELFFEDSNTFPQYVYAHRKPIASYTMEITDTVDSYQIKINDYSYDPDAQSTSDRGIKEYEWKWKETTSETWNNGKIPSSVPSGKDYIVQLRVKDYQNVWSDPISRYITTSEIVSPPIADFDMPSQSLIYESVSVNNTSYDPAGRSITEQEWVVTKYGVEMYRGSSPVTDFTPYGDGRYIVSLRVKNNAGLWSETFNRVIEITKDNIKPNIYIDNQEKDWTNKDIPLKLTFNDDGGSGFDGQRFVVTQTANPPSSGWSNWNSRLSESITINKEGINYVHVEARDNEGNQTKTTFGPYKVDKTKPTLNITVGEREKHEDVTLNLSAKDNLSGIKEIRLPDNKKTSNSNIQHIVNKNGTYEFVVEDNAGNIHTEKYTVSSIVRILEFEGPNIQRNVNVQLEGDMNVGINVGDIVISDWRDDINNWSLKLEATHLEGKSHSLPSGLITFKGIDKIDKLRGNKEGQINHLSKSTIIDDGQIEIISASNERGEYKVKFSSDALNLYLPVNLVKTDTYNTRLTWTLEATPQSK